jgi:hypothetical protein
MLGDKKDGNMQCYICKEEYDGDAIRARLALLREFFPPLVGEAALEIADNPANTAKLELLSDYFRESLFSTPDFVRQYRQLREKYFAIKVVCRRCGQELYWSGIGNIEHSVYAALADAEFRNFMEVLNRRCGTDVESLLALVGDRRSVVEFAVAQLKEVLGDKYDSVSTIHVFIEQFRDHGGRGGVPEWGGFALLRDYLTNEFVKNAIYDLIKASGVFVLGWIARRIRERRISSSAAKRMQELGSKEPRPYEDDLTSTFRYLTKRERAQLARKIASRISKEKLREIRKRLR